MRRDLLRHAVRVLMLCGIVFMSTAGGFGTATQAATADSMEQDKLTSDPVLWSGVVVVPGPNIVVNLSDPVLWDE